jgi:hypothetical protein
MRQLRQERRATGSTVPRGARRRATQHPLARCGRSRAAIGLQRGVGIPSWPLASGAARATTADP